MNRDPAPPRPPPANRSSTTLRRVLKRYRTNQAEQRYRHCPRSCQPNDHHGWPTRGSATYAPFWNPTSPDALDALDSPLSARESQIASMAAAGYANQEIADGLFITTHTVEYHLKKVFRKLGIVSGRQLRDKVGGELS